MGNKGHVASSPLEAWPGLTQEMVQRYASENSFHRGMEYYIQGAVLSLTRRGSRLMAEVQGSQYEPYLLRISIEAGDLVEAECSCPYEWDGICKHIVATLLSCVYDSDSIEERPDIETLLAALDRDQLYTILLRLSDRRPDLLDLMEKLALDPEDCNLDEEMPTSRSFLHV
jgi:uncharacterized Zn finger protein